MRKNSGFLVLMLLAICGILAGCGGEQTPPEPSGGSASQTAPESLPVSESASVSEARLEDAGRIALPPEHWLAGTSDADDMVPAVIAPEAPRVLLREEGDG